MARDTRPVICFIDDDPEEVEIFKDVFKDNFLIFASSRSKPVLDELKASRNRPNLFVLDLYFPKGRDSTPEERNKMILLQQKVIQAQKDLSDYLSIIGQGRQGGIDLIQDVREQYPTLPIVFYTRKGTLEDVDECREAGSSYVIKKPQPEKLDTTIDVYDQIQKVTREHKNALVKQFERFASSNGFIEKTSKVIKFIRANWGKF